MRERGRERGREKERERWRERKREERERCLFLLSIIVVPLLVFIYCLKYVLTLT